MKSSSRPQVFRSGKMAALFATAFLGSTLLALQPNGLPVQADSLTTGNISARITSHIGIDSNGNPDGTNESNCIHYQPEASSSSSEWVDHPQQAWTAHGTNGEDCPSKVNLEKQSAVGISPADETSLMTGTPFLLARVEHLNNPIVGGADYYKGNLDIEMGGFDGAPIISLPWWMWETPNQADPCPDGSNEAGCFDEIRFTSQIGNQIISQNGMDFRLVITGFIPLEEIQTEDKGMKCPEDPKADEIENDFWTMEDASTMACLYAEISQVREVIVTKTIVGNPTSVTAPSAAFSYTTAGTLAGSPWKSGAFSLTPAANGSASSTAKEIVQADSVTITETAPTDAQWALTGIKCTDFDESGNARTLPSGATYDVTAKKVVLSQVADPDYAANPDITCTFTNTYTPAATTTTTTTTLPAATTTTTKPPTVTTPATVAPTATVAGAGLVTATTAPAAVVTAAALPTTGRHIDWSTFAGMFLLMMGAILMIWKRVLR